MRMASRQSQLLKEAVSSKSSKMAKQTLPCFYLSRWATPAWSMASVAPASTAKVLKTMMMLQEDRDTAAPLPDSSQPAEDSLPEWEAMPDIPDNWRPTPLFLVRPQILNLSTPHLFCNCSMQTSFEEQA